MQISEKYCFNDFTEKNYEYLLSIAKEKFEFILYEEYNKNGNILLWRHDIDLSPNRALSLAMIEAKKSVKSTYFFYPHSNFYNLLDSETAKKVKEIEGMGHALGLHLDVSFYRSLELKNFELEKFFLAEKAYLESVLRCNFTAASFHQPEYRGTSNMKQLYYANMINVYSEEITSRFQYCSDSNGYWRFRPLEEVLKDNLIEKLQVLTHPGLWTKKAKSPATRVMRCIEGRAANTWETYCKELAEGGRENIGLGEFK